MVHNPTIKMASYVASAAILSSSAFFGAQAFAQQPTPQKWFKVCAKQADNDVCNTQYQVVASSGQVITSVNLLEIKGKVNRSIFQVTVPSNRLIPAGIAVKIDARKEQRIPYIYCFPNRCSAEVKLDDNLVKILKSGGEMLITSNNVQNKPNPIKISLNGFTASFDGPPLKKPAVEENTRKLQEELRKKADEARKKLQEAQEKAKQ